MDSLDELREGLPDSARDLKLNLSAVLSGEGPLTPAQRWGVAVASAIAARNPSLRDAMLLAASAQVPASVIEDAQAAAALMAMNNIFYRFRHIIEKPVYGEKPARLRMNRIAKPATNKPDFELFCLAVSAIENCVACVKSHEKAVLEGSVGEDAVHDAIRIAAVVNGVAVALELGAPPVSPSATQL